MERRVKASSESTVFLIMIVVGLVLLNVLSVFVNHRIDLTERRLHSLSAGTKRIVAGLQDRLTIRAYFSEDLPPPFNSHERAVRDLLEEYAAASGGKIRVEIIHPDGNENLEKQAGEDRIEKVPHAALKADEAREVLGYRGVAFIYRGESKSIPILSRDADISGLEYDFTTIIRQVIEQATGEKRTIGFTVGHGEPGVMEPPPRQMPNEPEPDPGISYLNKIIDTYNLREVSLKQKRPTHEDYIGLVVVGPTEEFPDADLYAIDQYLMHGGAVAFFLNGTTVEESMMGVNATSNETGLEALLETYGVQIGHDVVMDVQTDRFLVTAQMRTPMGNIPMAIPRPYPPWPHLADEQIAEDHALLFRLPGLSLLWPSTVRITREAAENSEIEANVLVRTSEKGWNAVDNFNLDPRQEESEWMAQQKASHRTGRFPLVVELSGTFPSHFATSGPPSRGEDEQPVEETEQEHLTKSTSPGRILVVGDADFLRIEYVGSNRRPEHSPANLTFMMNTLDWLAEDEDLIEIRAKRLEDPSLPEMTDAKRNWIKWGNIIAWPVLFLLFGVARWSWRKSARERIEVEWRSKKGGK
jgi:gliding-associated putative ABC transporter substrate-binding component GldG